MGAADGTRTVDPPVRRLLSRVALGYTVFVIYGSLVPLHFQRHPLQEAWQDFQHIPYLELGIGSRADWVANILLFVPLAFFWLGVLWPKRSIIGQVFVSMVVLAAALALSIGIEFTQIFFPPRTVSLNDIIAECIGAAIGIALWWTSGRGLAHWLAGWSRAHAAESTAGRLLHIYLFLVFGYNVMPLDLTISVVEIYHKWQQGKVLLVPFSAVYDSRVHMVYALLADVAIWIPAAYLWKISSRRSAGTVVLYIVACAALIEFLQLFVFSRVTSTTDVLAAACGGTMGVLMARWLHPGRIEAVDIDNRSGIGPTLLWLLSLMVWLGVLMAVFWYPFDFNTEWGFVHERLATLQRVPLEAYYYGTEFRAVTEVFHKTGFFFPLGALLALGAGGIRRRWAVPVILLHALSAVIVAGVAAGIELGQFFLPGKNADPTDWVLESLGGVAGYVCMRILLPGSRKSHQTLRHA